MTIQWDDFEKLDIRVGRITMAEALKNARTPAYVLSVDFGELGVKKSSAQLSVNYSPEQLIGLQVLAVVNFAPKQVGSVMSEVLVVGVPDTDGQPVLVVPERDVPLGGRLY